MVGDLNCGALQRVSIFQCGDGILVRAVANEGMHVSGPRLTRPEQACTDSRRWGVDGLLCCPWILNKSAITHTQLPTDTPRC